MDPERTGEPERTGAPERATGRDGGAVQAGRDPLIGQTLSHYRIAEKLGSGGMGVVYKAEDSRLQRFVALKFLSPDLAADPAALSRFRREARAASALNHANICTVHDIGEQDGRASSRWSASRGRRSKHLIAGARSTSIGCCALAIEIADALDAAHAAGHRSPRHQAGEHLRHHRRPRKDSRLRAGEGCANCRR